jgi:hypothetical protein
MPAGDVIEFRSPEKTEFLRMTLVTGRAGQCVREGAHVVDLDLVLALAFAVYIVRSYAKSKRGGGHGSHE